MIKILTLSKDDLEKQAILQKMASKFKKVKEYEESDVNEIIKSFDVDDHALFRRELINFGYLAKDSYKGIYWLKKSKLSQEDLEIIMNAKILSRVE